MRFRSRSASGAGAVAPTEPTAAEEATAEHDGGCRERLTALEAQLAGFRALALALTRVLDGPAAADVTSVASLARTLQRPDLHLPAEVTSEWASRIERKASRLGSDLTDLALLAGLAAGTIDLHRHPTDVARVLQAALEEIGPDPSITIDVPDGLEPPLVDPGHLATIVGHVLRLSRPPDRIAFSYDDALTLTVDHPRPDHPTHDEVRWQVIDGLARLHGGGLSTVAETADQLTRRVVLPDWPSTGPRVRVLVVDWAESCQWAQDPGDALDVARCGGLGAEGATEACPLIDRGRCPLVSDADVFVFNVTEDQADPSAVLREYQQREPGTPLIVAVPEALLADYEGRFPGAIVVPGPLDASRAADLVAGSLAPEHRTPTPR